MNSMTQPTGYYTPNSGGLGTVFHNQAGDLHTPNLGLNLMSPLSLGHQMCTNNLSADGSSMGLDPFNQQYMAQHYHNPQPFAQQATFAPGALVHRDSGYDAMDDSVDELSLNDMELQANASSQLVGSTVPTSAQLDPDTPGEKYVHAFSGLPTHVLTTSPNRFRYHVTLRAPTAMVKDHHEIPVSYLNKGQAYSLSVADTTPPPRTGQPVKYRTFVRVSFQDKEQRSKPASCWQLWKEGRGSNEAHQRGGRLQAVEYVDPIQGGIEDQKNRQVQLECSSFDGFCVIWTANPATGTPDCAISVRFNFLSTDFSHSKGVKGIPVRLCAKTEMLAPEEAELGPNKEPEVCFCKVKLFRDHGAERKLSNDIAHVKKSIEKLRQQIAQAEMGAGNYGKRKRVNGSVSHKGSEARPSKITKHRRTWSMGSHDGSDRMSMEDDLHVKLALMQEMFTSTRPVSILSLRGDEQDDPDLFPVQLSDARGPSKKEKILSQLSGDSFSPQFPSPMSTSTSLNSPFTSSTLQQFTSDSGSRGSVTTTHDSSDSPDDKSSVLKHPVKVQRTSTSDSNVSLGYIEAVDIDPAYRPPAESPPKPSKLSR